MSTEHRLYIGMENGLTILTQVNQGWQLIFEDQDDGVGLEGKYVIDLVYTKDNRCLYALVQGYGVFKTDDQRLTWQQLVSAKAYTILVDQINPQRLWVGIEPAGVLRTVDGGHIWQDLSEGLHALPGAIDWHYPLPPYQARLGILAGLTGLGDDLWAGIQMGGLCFSEDGGDTWTIKDEFIDQNILAIAHHPTSENIWIVTTDDGVYGSIDRGQTWQETSDGLDHFYVSAAVWLKNGVCLVAATSTGSGNWVENMETTLYYMRDINEPWQAIAGFEQHQVMVLNDSALIPQTVYLGTQSGAVFESKNSGLTWHQIWQGSSGITALLSVDHR